ncbi:MAG: hypothetical protein WBM66_07250, partial [Thiothrix litoralis]
DKIKAAGLTPIAHGGQPWQDATTFESIVLGTGGADFYRKAFVDLDPASLDSDTMVKAFDILRMSVPLVITLALTILPISIGALWK